MENITREQEEHRDKLVELAIQKGRNWRFFNGSNWTECLEPETLSYVMDYLMGYSGYSFQAAKDYVCSLLETPPVKEKHEDQRAEFGLPF